MTAWSYFIVQCRRKNEFLQTLKPIYIAELSYCHLLEMLKLNKRNDLYSRRDVEKLTCLAAKFQEDPIEPLREILLFDKHSSLKQ